MSTVTTDVNAEVKAQAKKIVAAGEDVRPHLAAVVSQNACKPEQTKAGLVGLVLAVIDGAKAGMAKVIPEKRDDVLRQVVDALGDGLSQTALAGKLAIEEAMSVSKKYAHEDLAQLRDDLVVVRELFADTVAKGLKTGRALTHEQMDAAATHARRVAERLGPHVSQAVDALRQNPAAFVREGLAAGRAAGEGATGSLFQAVGRMLQRAGDQLRHERGPGQ